MAGSSTPEIGLGEDLPNDFYIRNLDESTAEFTVSPNIVMTLQACYQGGWVVTEQDLATWSVLLGAEEDPGLKWDWYGAPDRCPMISRFPTRWSPRYWRCICHDHRHLVGAYRAGDTHEAGLARTVCDTMTIPASTNSPPSLRTEFTWNP